MVKVLTN